MLQFLLFVHNFLGFLFWYFLSYRGFAKASIYKGVLRIDMSQKARFPLFLAFSWLLDAFSANS